MSAITNPPRIWPFNYSRSWCWASKVTISYVRFEGSVKATLQLSKWPALLLKGDGRRDQEPVLRSSYCNIKKGEITYLVLIFLEVLYKWPILLLRGGASTQSTDRYHKTRDYLVSPWYFWSSFPSGRSFFLVEVHQLQHQKKERLLSIALVFLELISKWTDQYSIKCNIRKATRD